MVADGCSGRARHYSRGESGAVTTEGIGGIRVLVSVPGWVRYPHELAITPGKVDLSTRRMSHPLKITIIVRVRPCHALFIALLRNESFGVIALCPALFVVQRE